MDSNLLYSLFIPSRNVNQNSLNINIESHPRTHCRNEIELSNLLRANIAKNEKEIAAYTEEYNWRCPYKNAIEYMTYRPSGSYYYLFATHSTLSTKMIPSIISLVFVINIDGNAHFSFCPQFV
jgi:hypothetical protein